MKRILLIVGILLAGLAIGYIAGPHAEVIHTKPTPLSTFADLTKLDSDIAQYEAGFKLRPDNQARIVWADSNHKAKTPYSIVYVHGYTASWAEGEPVHKNLAKRFGCNLYLSRNAGHGLDSPTPMKDLSPEDYLASAERALAIGKALGDKVIVIGTSMGGMLTLYLASRHPEISGILLYSPCIEVANPALKLITKPWGQQILNQTFPGNQVGGGVPNPKRAPYWYSGYHTNGLLVLQTVLDEYSNAETFAKVKQPTFLGYYYKDEEHQDETVSVAAALRMYDELGTPAALKRKEAFPNANAHVIASKLATDDWPAVEAASVKFVEDILKLQPVATSQSTVALHPKK